MAITYKVCKCRNPKFPETPYFKATAVKAASDYAPNFPRTPLCCP